MFIPLLRGQKGFSLIEILAVVAIGGIIGLGATMATAQILDQGVRNSEYTSASRHSMNAIAWISRDAQMSQDVVPAGPNGFPLTLSWTEWDNSYHEVVYSIDGDRLIRSYSVDGGGPADTLVAQYVDSADDTGCTFSSGVLTIEITAKVGAGVHAVSLTKTREITPRPGL